MPESNAVREFSGSHIVAGVDEVGRGSWAGPLVVVAVAFDDQALIAGLTDSKKLSARQREALAGEIRVVARSIGISWISPDAIDDHGMTHSLAIAVQTAVLAVSAAVDEVVIDGSINFLSNDPRARSKVKADESVPAVAAASVIAKVARDAYMKRIASQYRDYGFERHVGYGTALHRAALERYGATKVHRMSFRPMREL